MLVHKILDTSLKVLWEYQSLFENSMNVSGGQRILWAAAEKFCNLLMLLNFYFYITFSTLFI